MEETVGQRKVVGAVWLLAAIVSIGAAFLLQPVGEWGTFGIVLAILVALLGITGAWMLITGKGRILNSNMSVKGQRLLSIIGLIAATILVIGYLVSDWSNWTAQDALTIGIWVAIGAMFLEGLIITSKSS
jgi:hypothetical protein